MKNLINVVFVSLLAVVIFSGCGGKQINLAKAKFIEQVAKNPGNFEKSNYNLVGHLVVDNRRNVSKKMFLENSFLNTEGMSKESKAKLAIYMNAFNKK